MALLHIIGWGDDSDYFAMPYYYTIGFEAWKTNNMPRWWYSQTLMILRFVAHAQPPPRFSGQAAIKIWRKELALLFSSPRISNRHGATVYIIRNRRHYYHTGLISRHAFRNSDHGTAFSRMQWWCRTPLCARKNATRARRRHTAHIVFITILLHAYTELSAIYGKRALISQSIRYTPRQFAITLLILMRLPRQRLFHFATASPQSRPKRYYFWCLSLRH